MSELVSWLVGGQSVSQSVSQVKSSQVKLT